MRASGLSTRMKMRSKRDSSALPIRRFSDTVLLLLHGPRRGRREREGQRGVSGRDPV